MSARPDRVKPEKGAKGGGKPKYGNHYQSKRPIGGPGIWVTCVRGMEKRCISEFLALLDEVADRLYSPERLAEYELTRPVKVAWTKEGSTEEGAISEGEGDGEEEIDVDSMEVVEEPVEPEPEAEEDLDESIEASIARELAELKAVRPMRRMDYGKGRDSKAKGPKDENAVRVRVARPRFECVETKVECVIFVSIAWPYDPMEITEAIVTELQATGVAKTKYTNRLEPVVISCHALSVEVVTRMTTELVTKDFNAWAIANNATHITYQIDPSVRLHEAPLNRATLVELIGAAVRSLSIPTAENPTPAFTTSANLTSPDLVLVPVILRNLYGLSICQGKLWSGKVGRKFNLDAIAKDARTRLGMDGEGGLSRVAGVREAKLVDGRMEVEEGMRIPANRS